MNTSTRRNAGVPSRVSHIIIKAALLPALVFILTDQLAGADSATWNLDPASGDWNTPAN